MNYSTKIIPELIRIHTSFKYGFNTIKIKLHMIMKKNYLNCSLVLLVLLLASCGDSSLSFKQVVVKSDRIGVLLDSKDGKVLSKLANIFNNKEEAPDADPEYYFFIDITTSKGTVRWQYSDKGYIRNIEIESSPIYHMPEYAEFNRIAKIR